MSTIKIKDRLFEVVRYDQAGYDRYRSFLKDIAKLRDRPLERFFKRIEGVTGQDRSDAIQGFMARRDWDEPPAEMVESVAHSRTGVLELACSLLRPALDVLELAELIGDDWQQVERDIHNALRPPTDAEIIARNQALKDRIKRQAQQEEKPCPTTSTAPPQ